MQDGEIHGVAYQRRAHAVSNPPIIASGGPSEKRSALESPRLFLSGMMMADYPPALFLYKVSNTATISAGSIRRV